MESAALKIGDKLWHFDVNRRVYEKDGNGRATGGPVYAGHFHQVEIVDQTVLSWVMEWGAKVSKKEISRDGFSKGFYTDAAKTDAIWLHTARSEIRRQLNYGQVSLGQWRQIARVLGLETP